MKKKDLEILYLDLTEALCEPSSPIYKKTEIKRLRILYRHLYQIHYNRYKSKMIIDNTIKWTGIYNDVAHILHTQLDMVMDDFFKAVVMCDYYYLEIYHIC